MLHFITSQLWHKQHAFSVNGFPITSRMTVVQLSAGDLLLHSPVPIDTATKVQIDELGEVQYIVAPNKLHHLFVAPVAKIYPKALLYGAPVWQRNDLI